MQTIPHCSDLSDTELRARLTRATAVERAATAQMTALLAEYDRRRLYLAEGYKSLFVFCTDALHLSEDAAYTRIQVARASRKWPQVLASLLDGSVSLTAIALLAPHFTNETVIALLEEARHKRKEAVRLIVARLNPQPDVASSVRKLPAARPESARTAAFPAVDAPLVDAPPKPAAVATTHVAQVAPVARPAVIAPLTPERFKIQITVDGETREVLRQAQDLLRHSIPNGDPALIIARALRSLVDELLKKKPAATNMPARARRLVEGSRAIPAAVKREVWQRDGGRCAFEGSRGLCGERGALEYHHVIPYAMGGDATAGNIELRCRTHNAYQASLDGLGRPADALAHGHGVERRGQAQPPATVGMTSTVSPCVSG